MQFACIQDCSVCPLSCRRNNFVSPGAVVENTTVPQAIQNSEIVETEKTEVPEEVEEHEKIENQKELNLPVISEIQYEIKDTPEKKGLFNFLKKR